MHNQRTKQTWERFPIVPGEQDPLALHKKANDEAVVFIAGALPEKQQALSVILGCSGEARPQL